MVSEVLDISQTIPDYKSLNPCSCGGWSQSVIRNSSHWSFIKGLNPCSCGGWSQSAIANARESGEYSVLILVLVEDGLRDS